MATIYREILVGAPASTVWDAVRDVGAPHLRLAPGFVIHTRLEGDERVVTFGNGRSVRERILGIDDSARRLAYSAVGGQATHHNASIQIFDDSGRSCRLVWATDALPDTVSDYIASMMDAALPIMRGVLEKHSADSGGKR